MSEQARKRHSVRLKGHDYVSVNVYYLTICSYQKECIFGEIRNGHMGLNEFGKAVKESWLNTERLRGNVLLDEFIIMPNHFHSIIWITSMGKYDGRGTARRAPALERFGKPVPGSLPTIVRSFKSAAAKRINELRGTPGVPVWQRNYYEHMIQNSEELDRIKSYIVNNPAHWTEDEENPESSKKTPNSKEHVHGE